VQVAVGLFGLGEILSTPSHQVTGDVVRPKLRELWPNRQEWRQSAMPIARGTVMGFLIGIIPGSAHIISTFSPMRWRRSLEASGEFGHGAVAAWRALSRRITPPRRRIRADGWRSAFRPAR